MKDGDDGPDSDVEDGIDDNSDEDSEAPAGAAIAGAAIAEEPAGAAIAVPAPASAPNPASDANPARKMMTAMSLLPAMHPGSPPGAGAGGFGDVARASSQRGRRAAEARARPSLVSVVCSTARVRGSRTSPNTAVLRVRILSVAGGARPWR